MNNREEFGLQLKVAEIAEHHRYIDNYKQAFTLALSNLDIEQAVLIYQPFDKFTCADQASKKIRYNNYLTNLLGRLRIVRKQMKEIVKSQLAGQSQVNTASKIKKAYKRSASALNLEGKIDYLERKLSVERQKVERRKLNLDSLQAEYDLRVKIKKLEQKMSKAQQLRKKKQRKKQQKQSIQNTATELITRESRLTDKKLGRGSRGDIKREPANQFKKQVKAKARQINKQHIEALIQGPFLTELVEHKQIALHRSIQRKKRWQSNYEQVVQQNQQKISQLISKLIGIKDRKQKHQQKGKQKHYDHFKMPEEANSVQGKRENAGIPLQRKKQLLRSKSEHLAREIWQREQKQVCRLRQLQSQKRRRSIDLLNLTSQKIARYMQYKSRKEQTSQQFKNLRVELNRIEEKKLQQEKRIISMPFEVIKLRVRRGVLENQQTSESPHESEEAVL